MQTDLALPDMPTEAIRLYPDSDRAIDAQRMEAERYVIFWHSCHVAPSSCDAKNKLCMHSNHGNAICRCHSCMHTAAH